MQKLPQQSRGNNFLQVNQDQEIFGLQQKENQYPVAGIPMNTDFNFRNNNIVPQSTPQVVWVTQQINPQQQFLVTIKEQTRKYSVCFYILSYFYTLFYVIITAQRVILSFLDTINIPSAVFFGLSFVIWIISLCFGCSGMVDKNEQSLIIFQRAFYLIVITEIISNTVFLTTENDRIGGVLSLFIIDIVIQIIFIIIWCKLISINKRNIEDMTQRQQIASQNQYQQPQNQ
ncbi:hypothetical protein pb186bvf_015417 [Paramecium bursaria]